MMMFFSVAPTMMSRSASLSSVKVGLMANFPPILATLTSETGPLKGMSETIRAAEAARPASASGIVSLSAEISITLTKVSAW